MTDFFSTDTVLVSVTNMRYARAMINVEAIENFFRNGVNIEESGHWSYYGGSEGYIWEQGGRTLVSSEFLKA